jgi:hypothetical protein
VTIDRVSAGDLMFRYEDMILRTLPGGSLDLSCVVLNGIDLATFDLGVAVDEAVLTHFEADLGAGMRFGFGSLKSGVAVDALVADSKYKIDLTNVEASGIEADLKDLGLNVMIDRLKGGAVKLDLDLLRESYAFDVTAQSLLLGPLTMQSYGFDLDVHAGLDLAAVQLTGAYQREIPEGLDPAKAEDLAKIQSCKTSFKIHQLTSTEARAPYLRAVIGSGKDATRVTLRSATLKKLALCDLDLDTMAMDLSFEDGDMKGLGLGMDGMRLWELEQQVALVARTPEALVAALSVGMAALLEDLERRLGE